MLVLLEAGADDETGIAVLEGTEEGCEKTEIHQRPRTVVSLAATDEAVADFDRRAGDLPVESQLAARARRRREPHSQYGPPTTATSRCLTRKGFAIPPTTP